MSAILRDSKTLFARKKVCGSCPFSTKVEPFLRTERVAEIAESLHDGGDFPCHKHTIEVENDDGEAYRTWGRQSPWCAGALAVMEEEGYSNQQVRIAERLGVYDPEAFKPGTHEVYGSMAEMVEAYAMANGDIQFAMDGDVKVPYEHCSVVGPDCEDPAGYATGGGAVTNAEPGTVNPFDGCSACGSGACSACRATEDGSGGFLCVLCVEDEDEDEEED